MELIPQPYRADRVSPPRPLHTTPRTVIQCLPSTVRGLPAAANASSALRWVREERSAPRPADEDEESEDVK
jgi:hypothetical protein